MIQSESRSAPSCDICDNFPGRSTRRGDIDRDGTPTASERRQAREQFRRRREERRGRAD